MLFIYSLSIREQQNLSYATLYINPYQLLLIYVDFLEAVISHVQFYMPNLKIRHKVRSVFDLINYQV